MMTLAPGLPGHGFRGGLFIAAGLLMLIRPPRAQIPRLPAALAMGCLLLAGMAFLPAAWFSIPAWRGNLAEAGMNLGGLVTAQPRQTLEAWCGIAVCLVVMLYLNGHRTQRMHRCLITAASMDLWSAYTIASEARTLM